MQTFSQTITQAQKTLDAHADCMAKIAHANNAMFQALRTLLEIDPKAAEQIFDASPDQLRGILAIDAKSLQTLVAAGLPLFTIRLATPDFHAALIDLQSRDIVFSNLLRTFSRGLPLSSLSSDPSEKMSVSNTVLDVQDIARKSVEVANAAVLDVVKALMASNDPLAGEMLGIEVKYLEAIVNANRSTMRALTLTGVPLFALKPVLTNFHAIHGLDADGAAMKLWLTSLNHSLT